MTTLCIDGDLLAFRCAAANEERYVVATHNDTLEQIEFDTATKFKEWAGSKADNYVLEPKQRPKPEAFAFKTMNGLIEKWVEQTGSSSYHIVLSGENNFRDALPLPFHYKQNRDGLMRPLALEDCRQYLMHRHKAEVAEGEADDLLAAYAWQGRNDKSTIVASIDKDQMGCEGWVFNWTTMTEPFLVKGFGELVVSEKPNGKVSSKGVPLVDKSVTGWGKIWLLFQCLNGDGADFYKPCDLANTKFGEMSSYDILKHCKTQEETFKAVLNKYKLWYPEPVTYRDCHGNMQTKDYVEIFQMYADCAYMRKWDGDRFDVKKVMEAYELSV